MILHSKIIGNAGRDIIILHGLYGSSDSWLRVAKLLLDNFTIHLLDLRNHGESFKNDVHTYQAMVEDVKSYLDDKKISDVDLIGHSMGGKLAMFFVAKYPKYIRKLVIADISPRSYKALLQNDPNGNFHLNLLSIMKNLDLAAYNSYRSLSKELREHGVTIENVILKNVEKNNRQFVWKLNVSALFNNINNILEGLNPDDFIDGKITTETLFLKASNSNYITSSDKKIIDFIFVNAHIKEITNAGHWLHYDNPNDTVNEILAFLNE
ncbi:MAG: alpha/beta fold hydrolase [Bacteroidales bacterium]|nr:alpha/beta fold hydrolase [Bacteroidales bacterium]